MPESNTAVTDDERNVAIFTLAGSMLVLAALVFAVTYRHSELTTITAVSWEREIRIDLWQTVRKEGWSVPQNGRAVSSTRKIREWKQVWVGSHEEKYSCGTYQDPNKKCTRSVDDYSSTPVWDDYYTYDIDEWTYEKSLTRHGSDHNVAWADTTDLRFTSPSTGTPSIGDEREASRIEHYRVYVPDPSELPYDQWVMYTVGQRVRVYRNILGAVIAVEEYVEEE